MDKTYTIWYRINFHRNASDRKSDDSKEFCMCISPFYIVDADWVSVANEWEYVNA